MEEIDEINDALSEGAITNSKESSDFIVSARVTSDGYEIYQIKPSDIDDSQIEFDKHLFYYLPSSEVSKLLLDGKIIFINQSDEFEHYYSLIEEIHGEIV